MMHGSIASNEGQDSMEAVESINADNAVWVYDESKEKEELRSKTLESDQSED